MSDMSEEAIQALLQAIPRARSDDDTRNKTAAALSKVAAKAEGKCFTDTAKRAPHTT